MQEIQLFNTLGREKQKFVPLENDRVKIYHCGPTVYWTQHIGNMRAVFFGDIVHRTLSYLGYQVTFVRNYTDVGHMSGDNDGDADQGQDRMEIAAEREGLSPEAIAAKYKKQFDQDTEKLGLLVPHHRPSATEYIDQMIAMAGKLLDDNFAYQTELAIYFDTSQAADYYRLSGQKVEDLHAGAGHGDVADPEKKNPTDFALWFFKAGAHQAALQTWPNPFSDTEGFPGWHIECSAMIKDLLGETIDIHLGGIEHIPIHHTNEIAQSESANKATLANYWLHNEHLLVDGGKMSKSGGTAYSINELETEGFSASDLRYFFLQAHYRSKQNFTWEALRASQTARKRLLEAVAGLKGDGVVDETFNAKFSESLF